MRRDEAMKLRRAIVQGSESLTDEAAQDVPYLFEPWVSDREYKAGDRKRYGDTLYKCLQAHTSQADWTPDVAVSLWVRVDDPSVEWPEWVQPTGAQDAYSKGAKVSHTQKHWVSNVDGNVWEPGAVGTETLWREA
jgi:hypothetical protein